MNRAPTEQHTNDLYYSDNRLSSRFYPALWNGDSFQDDASFAEMYERINSKNPTLVIDAGCGRNKHKEKIKNLIGFDPSPFPNIDFCSTILDADFENESADAVLALGSIQFFSKDYIKQNIEKVLSWCKPNGLIEMRIAPDKFSTSETWHYCHWEIPWISEFTNEFNLAYIVEPIHYVNTDGNNRVRWTWVKK